jgi:hypothetical protein
LNCFLSAFLVAKRGEFISGYSAYPEFLKSYLSLISLKYGCCNASTAVILYFGFFLSILSIRSIVSVENFLYYSPFKLILLALFWDKTSS